MRIVRLATLALFLVPTLTAAQTQSTNSNMEILRDKIKADKKLVIAANMDLTETEAKAFWPVYDQMQGDLAKLNKRTAKLISGYAMAYNDEAMTDDKAQAMIDGYLEVQIDEANLMKTLAPRLGKILPATKVARYLQIENKIRAAIDYDMAAQIPLIPDAK